MAPEPKPLTAELEHLQAEGSMDTLHRNQLPERIRVGEGERLALFVMLNPATEDPQDDEKGVHKTRERCRAIAQRFGCGWYNTVNLFTWRARKPRALRQAIRHHGLATVIGPDNDRTIIAAAQEIAVNDGWLICAWGANGDLGDRDRAVMALLRANVRIQPRVLGRTNDGLPYPYHPLARVRGIGRTLWPYEGR